MKLENLRDVVARPLMNIIPFSLLKRIVHREIMIAYYHVVNDEDAPHITHLYKYKNARQFADDLDFLLKHYSPIGLADLIHWRKGERSLPPSSFLLTFDDGFREISDVIGPILLERGLPATFFIPSAFLDNRELCYQHKASLLVEKIRKGVLPGAEKEIKGILVRMGLAFSRLSEGILKVDYRRRDALDGIAEVLQVDFQRFLNENQPYLTSSQVETLMNRGFTIGAHSIDHPYYSTLSLDEQMEQTLTSVKFIREKFSLDYGAFAFPHNDTGVSPDFFKMVEESGLVDITFGTGGMMDGDYRIHRQRVNLEKPVRPARELIAWQYMRRLYRQLRRKG